MELTAELVAEQVRAYPEIQPLAVVETEHLELLPDTFARGEYGRRDAEWVVQWYVRRHLGASPDDEARAVESAYAENDFETVRTAIAAAREADETAAKLRHLRTLEGVDVSVGSAFLQFIDPDSYLVASEREWRTLRRAGALAGTYPDPPTIPEYERYLSACRTVADDCDCSLWELYRALWVLSADDE